MNPIDRLSFGYAESFLPIAVWLAAFPRLRVPYSPPFLIHILQTDPDETTKRLQLYAAALGSGLIILRKKNWNQRF